MTFNDIPEEIINTETIQRTVGSYVADNYKAAGVFQKYGIDFCCGGGQSVDAACEKHGVDSVELLGELEALNGETAGAEYKDMPLDQLIDHICVTHHAYIVTTVPNITAFANKVADAHGPRHPEVIEIRDTFLALADELQQHMFKEENILFPYIKRLVATKAAGGSIAGSQFGTIQNPIGMMEDEHESAGNALERISMLSSGYTPPEDACTTYRVLYQELQDFENDLHLHIHKENNILHPRAIKLEQELL